MAETWSVADAVASFLESRGIVRTYGLTGGEVTDLISSIEVAGIEFILTHHENCAAFMADAEAQLAGRPGVCISTVGPGATNMVNGVANSYLDRTPLLALIGDMEADVRDSWTHMSLDLVRLFEPVSRFADRITPDNVYSILPKAWAATTAGPDGPACLMLSAADAVVEIERRAWPGEQKSARARIHGPAPDSLAESVRASENPVIVLGLGARTARISNAAAAFAERWDAPVVLTPKAKGCYPAGRELFAGVYASYGSGGVERLLSEADLIVGVGLDGSDFIRPWRFGEVLSLSENAAPDTAYPSKHFPCDIARTLENLTASGTSPKCGAERAAAARTEAERGLMAREAGSVGGPERSSIGIDPVDAIAAMRRVVPRDTVVTCDVGMLKLVLCQFWPVNELNTFLVSNGLSTMGYGLPAALGASLHQGGAPAVSILGDGGLLMYAGELETLARSAARVIAIVAVDSTLGLIRLKAEDSDLDGSPNDFGAPDYVTLAASMGVKGLRAESADDLADKVRSSLAGDGSTLIEVPIDFDAYRRMA